jgi:hypothetical protein
VSSLFDIDSSMPSSVVLQGEGHSSLSDHVTEGSLSCSGCSRSRNSWDTSNGSTGSPGFGRVFHSGLVVNGMGLSAVLRKVGVNKLNDVQSDGGLEYGWHSDFGFSNL